MSVGVMKDYKTRVEESTRLTCPLLVGELEHLKTETRLIDEIKACYWSVSGLTGTDSSR